MKSILSILIVLLVASAVSCGGAQPATEDGSTENINFMISSYQFVKNTYKGETNPSYLIIRSYPAFESLFGVGAVMGMDKTKLITEENMKNRFVLSIIYQGNDIHEFGIEKIILNGSRLEVYYTSRVTEPNASWTCNCHVTALVDNCKFDSVLLYENGKPLPDAKIKDM
ncbi:MAG: hypothetical protein PHO26_07380 [Dehalococcoidia bacterium]|nr:hypothetical protein [Dehalococcoidia bacterium]MDD5494949.1 hypothetical protein [Dehalococcoidia bacterium]